MKSSWKVSFACLFYASCVGERLVTTRSPSTQDAQDLEHNRQRKSVGCVGTRVRHPRLNCSSVDAFGPRAPKVPRDGKKLDLAE